MMTRWLSLALITLSLAGCNAPPADDSPDAGEPVNASNGAAENVGARPADADLPPVQPPAPQPRPAAAPASPSVRFYRVQDPFLAEGPGKFIKGTSSQIHLLDEPFLDESGIASAKAVAAGPTAPPGTYHVQVWFTPAGAQTISAVTSEHPGEQIAIVVNGEVVAAPKVRGTVGESAYIAGEFTRTQAEALAAGLDNPAEQ